MLVYMLVSMLVAMFRNVDRYVGRHIGRHIGISVGRYVGRYVGRHVGRYVSRPWLSFVISCYFAFIEYRTIQYDDVYMYKFHLNQNFSFLSNSVFVFENMYTFD